MNPRRRQRRRQQTQKVGTRCTRCVCVRVPPTVVRAGAFEWDRARRSVDGLHACAVRPCLVDDDGTLCHIPKERCGGDGSSVAVGGVAAAAAVAAAPSSSEAAAGGGSGGGGGGGSRATFVTAAAAAAAAAPPACLPRAVG